MLSGATAESVFNSKIDETVPWPQRDVRCAGVQGERLSLRDVSSNVSLRKQLRWPNGQTGAGCSRETGNKSEKSQDIMLLDHLPTSSATPTMLESALSKIILSVLWEIWHLLEIYTNERLIWTPGDPQLPVIRFTGKRVLQTDCLRKPLPFIQSASSLCKNVMERLEAIYMP